MNKNKRVEDNLNNFIKAGENFDKEKAKIIEKLSKVVEIWNFFTYKGKINKNEYTSISNPKKDDILDFRLEIFKNDLIFKYSEKEYDYDDVDVLQYEKKIPLEIYNNIDKYEKMMKTYNDNYTKYNKNYNDAYENNKNIEKKYIKILHEKTFSKANNLKKEIDEKQNLFLKLKNSYETLKSTGVVKTEELTSLIETLKNLQDDLKSLNNDYKKELSIANTSIHNINSTQRLKYNEEHKKLISKEDLEYININNTQIEIFKNKLKENETNFQNEIKSLKEFIFPKNEKLENNKELNSFSPEMN